MAFLIKSRTCNYCNKEFRPINGNQKFCSVHCRFWSKVDIKDSADCWEWQGAKHFINRYGQFRLNQKTIEAHRISWELTNGMIPKGFTICHHCDNPACVNPQHLFIGTQKDNIHDMIKKNRNRGILKGILHPNAKLTPEIVKIIKSQISKGISQTQIAAQFNVSNGTIHYISRGVMWKHVH